MEFLMSIKSNIFLVSLLAAGCLTGCIDESDDNSNIIIGSVPCGPEHAVAYSAPTLNANFITAVHVADFGDGSNVEFIEEEAITQSSLLAAVDTDYAISGRNGHLYYLGRDQIDTLQKYYHTSPDTGLYQTDNSKGYSTRDAGQDSSPNAKMIGFINDSTAILPRYADNKAWVVNLDAQLESEFKICELDLSAYVTQVADDPETIEDETAIYPPNMARVDINENYAAITMQRLTNWATIEPAYVAIFDLATWQEVNTNAIDAPLKGIELNLKNPQFSSLTGNKLYLSSVLYSDYSGGIEEVNLSTLSARVVNTESGYWDIEATDNGNIYAITYEGWKNNNLVQINENSRIELGNNSGKHLISLASRSNQLWVGTGAKETDQPGVSIYNTTDNTLVNTITPLQRNPESITFVEK